MYTLLAAMDLPPTTKLRVVDSSTRPLPPRTARTVDEVLSQALHRRPDLLADVAKLRATDAEYRGRSFRAGSQSFAGCEHAGQSRPAQRGPGALFSGRPAAGRRVPDPRLAALRRRTAAEQAELAQSQREEAADELKVQTDQAFREVALAYDQVDTGLQQYDAAIALQTASEAAFDSASDAYAHGVGTLTDATSAQTGLATARAAVARAHAQSLINAAALAFATGELTSSTDFATATPR